MASMIICPKCGSDNTELVFGGLLGTYKCNKCDFEGIFPEVEINDDSEADKIMDKVRRVR